MSMESALAALNNQKPMDPPQQHLDPNTATKVENKTADPNLTLDLKSDSLVDRKPTASVEGIKDPPKVEAKEEAPKEDKKEEPKEEKTVEQERAARNFAVLAKKERELYRASQQLKERETTLGDREAKVKTYENLKAQALENPMLALKELGITYDDLTKYVVSGKMPQGEGAKIDEVKRELETLRNKLAQKEKAEEEAKVQAEKEKQTKIINDFKLEIVDHIKVNAEKYELCSLYPDEARDLVFRAIENHYGETQQIMSVDEGCTVAETYLEKQAQKVLLAKKILAKVQPPPKTSAQPRTLSNEMTTSAPSFLPAKTEADRINRALAALSR